MALDELPTTMATTSSGRAAWIESAVAISSWAMRPWRHRNSQGAYCPAARRSCCAKLPADFVEVGFHDGDGVSQQLHGARQVGYPENRDPARPDRQEAGRGGQRPRGRRSTVEPHD